MCKDCFIIEIESFHTEHVWLNFDLKLTQKLGSGKIKNTDFIRDCKRDKDDGEYIYICQTCNQKWRLREPNYPDRGYFVKF